jgi:hypothetical protein
VGADAGAFDEGDEVAGQVDVQARFLDPCLYLRIGEADAEGDFDRLAGGEVLER